MSLYNWMVSNILSDASLVLEILTKFSVFSSTTLSVQIDYLSILEFLTSEVDVTLYYFIMCSVMQCNIYSVYCITHCNHSWNSHETSCFVNCSCPIIHQNEAISDVSSTTQGTSSSVLCLIHVQPGLSQPLLRISCAMNSFV